MFGESPRASEVADRAVTRASAADPVPRAARPAGETASQPPREPHGEADRETNLVAPEILIPAYVGPDGCDSLGRRLDEGSVAIASMEDRAVR
jgi:hypothetical protein